LPESRPILLRGGLALRCLACGFVVVLFACGVARFYRPESGFTSLIEFGSKEHPRFLREVKASDHYEQLNSFGYDGQWYAQIAMHPRPWDPKLRAAVDTLPYRARRILFEWTAWLIAGGNPTRAMHVYAIQGIACWLLLATLLFRWLPPTSWENVFRWTAVLFSFGLIFSVKAALLDGPSLLLIAVSMALIELKRPWWAAAVLGISGLGKETNVLSASALEVPDSGDTRAKLTWLAQLGLAVLPVLAWTLCLWSWFGIGDEAGTRNLSGMFLGLPLKLEGTVSTLLKEGYPFPSKAKIDLLVLIGLTAQFAFLASRIRWRDPWWRLGASYAVLSLFLGGAVWEGYPSAAARVLLPMTLAFNILVPRGRLWLVLLIVGNLGALGSVDLLHAPERKISVAVEGPVELRINPEDGYAVQAAFGAQNWWPLESDGPHWWRWASGDGTVTIHNPQSFALLVDVRFGVATGDVRGASATTEGIVVWRASLRPAEDHFSVIPGLVLPPGDTTILFQSDRPAASPGPSDRRLLTFSVRDMKVEILGRH
jgi:hypothetical protein